jgi:polyhydroxybutyrate depolymerase
MKPSILATTFLLFVFLAACNRPLRQGNSTPDETTPIQDSLSSGNHNLSTTVDGLERTYILHVPPAASEPLPLIIVLHGTYGTGRKMQLGLGFDPYADQRGFYVAYPDAYQKPGERETARWNDGRGTLESSLTGIDDVKFLVGMVDDIAAQVPLDKSRVFVTGASNGGMMTYRLGCETSGVFAGIAPVIGNIPEPIFDSCSPPAPLKFLAINGDADPFVPFNGGEVCGETPSIFCEGGFVQSQPESLTKFAAANRCELAPQSVTLPNVVDDGTSIEEQTYANCADGAQVKAYIIHNGGHTWPPHESQVEAGGQTTGNLDATAQIVDFFLGQ